MQVKGSNLFRLLLHFFIIVLIIVNVSIVHGTHLQGTFDTQEFFKFLIKFGFQKAEFLHLPHNSPHDSYGYIYGNVTAYQTFAQPITLVVLDKWTFIDFYSNRSASIYDRELACRRMFQQVQLLAYDPDCNVQGKRDFIRRIPCPYGQLCPDEDAPSNVVTGNQFTYVISEVTQPRFWYVAMVACYRNRTTCQWHAYDTLTAPAAFLNNSPHELHYDIHVVNGHPNSSSRHPLTYEFSFDQQNLLEMYLIFLLVYVILLPMQIYAVRLQKHPVTKLFTISLCSEFISLTLITGHLIKFAINGNGLPNLQTSGDILDIFSRTTFMLILLLLAKGWAVTRQQISRTGWIILMSIWVPYCSLHVFLYYWNRTEVDIVSDIDEYQTWPGLIVLILRTTFMLWFLYELRNTMKYEHSTKKLDFLLHLGASSLVWFIYLPIVALVALQVSPMWRYKLLLGITNSADCLAYCVMTGLLWPNRSGQYLLLTGTKYAGMDELDEFNEAPHIVRERERGPIDSLDVLDNITNNQQHHHHQYENGTTITAAPGATLSSSTTTTASVASINNDYGSNNGANGSAYINHNYHHHHQQQQSQQEQLRHHYHSSDLLHHPNDIHIDNLLTDLNKSSHIVA